MRVSKGLEPGGLTMLTACLFLVNSRATLLRFSCMSSEADCQDSREAIGTLGLLICCVSRSLQREDRTRVSGPELRSLRHCLLHCLLNGAGAAHSCPRVSRSYSLTAAIARFSGIVGLLVHVLNDARNDLSTCARGGKENERGGGLGARI